jgi:2-dehydropantoate 2-reductase
MTEHGADRPILIVGAGAVGGYLAAHLARLGEAVVVYEPWAPNRDAIARRGFQVSEPAGDFEVRMPTIATVEEIPAIAPRLTVLCTKLADAPAVVSAIERVHRGTWLVTLNALADLAMAKEFGAERVMGCIVTGHFANLTGPGAMRRHRRRFDGGPPTFRLGEAAGPASPRIHALVERLSAIDGAEAVDDMAAARWAKLVFNSMTSALSALEARPIRDIFTVPQLRARMTAVALEAVDVSLAAGVAMDPVCGVPGATWAAAAAGDAAALAALDAGLVAYGDHMNPTALSGMAQDRARGRRTEAWLINGTVVAEARRLGRDAPANVALIDALDAPLAA